MYAWWLRNRQRILQLAGTIMAVGLLVYLLKEDGWYEIIKAFKEIKSADLIWVAILFLISRVATGGRWHVLLRSGGIDMRLKDSMALTFTGLFASNFLPTTIGGDVVRLAGAMQMGFDRAVCLASIAAVFPGPPCCPLPSRFKLWCSPPTIPPLRRPRLSPASFRKTPVSSNVSRIGKCAIRPAPRTTF